MTLLDDKIGCWHQYRHQLALSSLSPLIMGHHFMSTAVCGILEKSETLKLKNKLEELKSNKK
jgi:hypothetical protein